MANQSIANQSMATQSMATQSMATQSMTNELNELKDNISYIKNKLESIPMANISSIDADCDKKINIVKTELSNKIETISNNNKNTKNNYINNLFDLLYSNEIITNNEIINIKTKYNNNQIDQDSIIQYLENKKKLNKQIFLKKNQQNISNYDNLLNGKWQVPMPRPPVCINNNSDKINNYDISNSSYSSIK